MKSHESENRTAAAEGSKAVAMRVSVVSIIVNLLLSVYKLIAGIAARSGAMVSDAVHSASDVFSTFVVMIGMAVSGKAADKEHPFGHERLECVASIVLAVILAATGIGIGIKGLNTIISGTSETLAIPGTAALIASVISMAVKEAMYWYTRAAAKKINSGALMADAWHHRSDALSSVGAFVGILGARLGFPILDPAASVIICVFICKAALDIFKDAVDKMIDTSCPDETEDAMKQVIRSVSDVEAIDVLRTRMFGSRIYVEVEILMDGCCTLIEAHQTAEQVHDRIEEHFPEVKHCMVHVNPRIES